MYTSFTARNFRGFRSLTIEPLGRINLIAGANNVGKTALLEAIFLHTGAYNPALVLRVNGFRGFERLKIDFSPRPDATWDSVFFRFDMSECIELVGENTVTGRRSLRLRDVRDPSDLMEIARFISYARDETEGVPSSPSFSYALGEIEGVSGTPEIPRVLELTYEEPGKSGKVYLIMDARGVRAAPPHPPPPFPAFFLAARSRVPFEADAERFGRLERRGKEDVLLPVLQIIEPRLTRLAMVFWAGQPILHGDIGIGHLVPLPVMGEGMARLASLVLRISSAPEGVVLADEIENGLHYSVLPSIWRAVGEAAESFGTQVIATTHSFECIRAAHEALNGDDRFDFRLHRLERVDDDIRVVTFSGRQLASAIASDLEIR